jgi:hypothetical protein
MEFYFAVGATLAFIHKNCGACFLFLVAIRPVFLLRWSFLGGTFLRLRKPLEGIYIMVQLNIEKHFYHLLSGLPLL